MDGADGTRHLLPELQVCVVQHSVLGHDTSSGEKGPYRVGQAVGEVVIRALQKDQAGSTMVSPKQTSNISPGQEVQAQPLLLA